MLTDTKGNVKGVENGQSGAINKVRNKEELNYKVVSLTSVAIKMCGNF